MRIAFRADASTAIGTGHVMRGLTLAETLRDRGADIRFLCRDFPGHAAAVIAARGFPCTLLPAGTRTDSPPPSHASWLGAGWEEDAAACAAALAPGVDGLVVDHYALDARWERALRPMTRRILAIDDLADRPHDCDLLLDQNLAPRMPERYAPRVPPACRLLLGPTYSLLAPPFARLATRAFERSQIRRLHLFFGGGDPGNLTGCALRQLDPLGLPGDVVIVASNPHRAAIEALCQASGGRWTLHVQTPRMAELMLAADFALGAGGGAHWERCLLGLPAAVVVTAANQALATASVAERGACLALDESATLAPGAFRRAVESLAADPGALRAMSRAALGIVPDARGAQRVADAFLETPA